MPAYSADYTARYKVKFNDGVHTHTQTWRFAGVGGEPELTSVREFLVAWYAAFSTISWDDTTLISTSVAARDNSIFLPATPFSFTPGIVAAAGRTRGNEPVALSFTGRSQFGNPWKIFQYGVSTMPGVGADNVDYRISEAEEAAIASMNAAMATYFGVIVANDGGNVYVNTYANIKANDYWVGQVRG